MGRVKGGAGVDEYIRGQKPEYRPVLKALRTIVNRAAPALEEKMMWGQPMFVRGKEHVVMIYVAGDHVNFGLLRAVELDDPDRRLEGTGKGMRHVKVWRTADIDAKYLAGLVRQAVALPPK